MPKLSRSRSLRSLPLSGLEIVPPTLLVAMQQYWLGAGTLGAVLAAWVIHSQVVARAERESEQALLSYAHTAMSMGENPAPVITAMRAAAGDDPEEPSADAAESGQPTRLHLPRGRW